MKDCIYINDIGILNAQGSGKSEVLSNILNGERSFSLRQIEDTYYNVGLCSIDADTKRIFSILDQCCEQISPCVEEMKKKYGKERIGVILGSTDNGSERSLAAHREFLERGCFPQEYKLHYQQADFVARYVKDYFGLNSLCMAVSTACTSSAGAIVNARNLIQSGIVDSVIAGGADIVSDTVLKGFISLDAVDPSPCKPFSANRKGINLGEGGALMVLSKKPYGQESIVLTGCGEKSDAYHITAPDPEGHGAYAAMKEALEESGLDSVDYINLHGTGTPLNDAMEGKATSALLGKTPFVSSTKSMIGHTLGAAGAMELGLCWLLLSSYNKKNQLPPHLWDGERDSTIADLKFTDKQSVPGKIMSCMSNSYAFGGNNVSLIIERTES